MHIILLPFVVAAISAQKLTIRNLGTEPLLVLDVQNCKIQEGNFKIIHPINLTEIEQTLKNLHSNFLQAVRLDSSLYNIVSHKIYDLYYAISQLKPRRRKRWDQIGTIWKWLAGSPDAEDLRIINTTFNNIVDGHNGQHMINEGVNRRLTKLTQSLNAVIRRSNNDNETMEITAMKFLLNVNVMADVVTNIQDAVIGARVLLPSSKILTTSEVDIIAESLTQQGVELQFLEEALDFVEPKVAVTKDVILYIIQLPQISNQTSRILEVVPLPIQGQSIINHPKTLVQYQDKLFTTTTPKAAIQKMSDLTPFKDSCIKPLLEGTSSICQSSRDNETTAVLVTSNKILVKNARNTTLTSSCSLTNKRLNGNLLLTLEDCEVELANQTFKITDISQKTDRQGLFYDSLIHLKEEKQHNIAEIDEATLNNTKLL